MKEQKPTVVFPFKVVSFDCSTLYHFITVSHKSLKAPTRTALNSAVTFLLTPSTAWNLLPFRVFFSVENRKSRLSQGQVNKAVGFFSTPRLARKSCAEWPHPWDCKTLFVKSSLFQNPDESPFNLKAIRPPPATS